MRLRGVYPWNGFPQIYESGGWGVFSGDGWDSADSAVVARTFGLSHEGQRAWTRYPADDSATKVARTQVSCAGEESSILDCPFTAWSDPSYFPRYNSLYFEGEPAARFSGGAVATSGALEYTFRGQWCVALATLCC